MKIILIDNYDSFTFNLFHYLSSLKINVEVIRNNKIIAVEDDNGTDKMLKKCIDKNIKNNGLLIKFPKEKQDLRIDLPTVGLKTFYQWKKYSWGPIINHININII